MIDLYAILGLSRDADTRAIRKAYRQKAREAHPDVGGTREHFGMVSTALAVLGDHGRRQHYDATGQFENVPADNGRGKALETLSQILDAAGRSTRVLTCPVTAPAASEGADSRGPCTRATTLDKVSAGFGGRGLRRSHGRGHV